MQEIIISVFNMVGSAFCVEADDGQKVYDLIEKALHEGKKIKLSFQNVEMLTSAFLNTAIGQLYRDFTEEKIKSSLSVKHMLPEDKERGRNNFPNYASQLEATFARSQITKISK